MSNSFPIVRSRIGSGLRMKWQGRGRYVPFGVSVSRYVTNPDCPNLEQESHMARKHEDPDRAGPLDEELGNLVGEVGLRLFPPDVVIAVEASLARGQSLEPSTRIRFVDAAQRGVRR